MSSDDYCDDFKNKLQDGIGDLLAKVATGELSRKDAQREVDIMRAFCELVVMITEKWHHFSPEEREATMIAMWPEACRRAEVGVIDMPDDVLAARARAARCRAMC